MKTISNNSNETAANVVRNLQTLEAMYSFRGESIAKAGDVTAAESIRLGVALINRGEESKARGVFVLAEKARKLTAEELKAFRDAIRSEMQTEAKAKVIALNPGADAKTLEKVKNAAADEASKRFDNLGQTLRAAQWMLANPKKVADGLSVFTVQQALAYVDAPTLKDGAEKTAEGQTKLACHKAVAGLLAKPGTSQGAIKEAVKAAKEKVAKAHEPKDTRTEAQKEDEERTADIAKLPSRVEAVVLTIDKLTGAGVKVEDIRSAKLTEAVKALAKLAGVEVSK